MEILNEASCERVRRCLSAAPRLNPPRGNHGGRKYHTILDLVSAFDIETSSEISYVKKGRKNVPEGYAWLYLWQFSYEHGVVFGRDWNSFRTLVTTITEALEDKERLVAYVHNLSYEAQFLFGVFNVEQSDVFAMERRKIAKLFVEKIEFRCSYIHSNMSLARFLQYMDVETQKGEIDHSVKRYPWSELPDEVLDYGERDVKGLSEAIRKELDETGDTLQTIPLTSTGYVRRDMKKALQAVSHFRVRRWQPSLDCYVLLREAFRGGDTHANRYYSGMILDNLKSRDISSAYPYAMCCRKLPSGEWRQIADCSPARLDELIYKRKKAAIFRCAFKNIRLRDEREPDPVLSLSKTRNPVGYWDDNGRILKAAYIETTITDVDYRTMKDCYCWDNLDVFDVHVTYYCYLPDPCREIIYSYFKAKTELKGVDSYFYAKSKNKLNAFYGLSATDPIRMEWLFNPDTGDVEPGEIDVAKLIEKNRYSISLSYSFAPWVTAIVRYILRIGIKAAGNRAVYWDTDSVKYVEDDEIERAFDEYNRCVINAEYSALDKSGKRHYMGVFEADDAYRRFVTLGAKKYAYESAEDGALHTTIAGVSKKEGPSELGRLENFKPGFVFSRAAGKMLIYNDLKEPYTVEVDGNQLTVTRNVVIAPNTYTIGLSESYENLLYSIAQKRKDEALESLR